MLAGAKGRDLVEMIPRDRVLLETDGPFAQVFGAPLNPWNLGMALRSLAEVWNMELDDVHEQIVSNERRVTTWASAPISSRPVRQ